MVTGHHHHHHHHHAGDDDMPLDAANQSLADALKASFGVLKLIMFVLVILFCFSGVKCIEENEQAVVLRFGKLLPEVHDSGLSWAFPYPIDETLVFPTKKSNQFTSWVHWPKVRAGKESEPLDKTRAGGGLDPAIDGSLLTVDSGMVHILWRVTYRVGDLRDYVLNVADHKTEPVENLITALLQNAAVRVVSKHTAESVTRGGTTTIASAVRREINTELEGLHTGVNVVTLEIPRSSVPGQTIQAFSEVTNAENEKKQAESEAWQAYEKMLYGAAGATWKKLIDNTDRSTGVFTHGLIDQWEDAVAAHDEAGAAGLLVRIDQLVETEAGGGAGEAIRQANGFYTSAVQGIKGDVQEYEAALPEFLGNRSLFINRMWERTRLRVLSSDGVKKHILSGVSNEIRIKIGEDPEQRRLDETRKLQQEAEGYDYQGPKKLHSIVPGMEHE